MRGRGTRNLFVFLGALAYIAQGACEEMLVVRPGYSMIASYG